MKQIKELLSSLIVDKSNNAFKKVVSLLVTIHFMIASFLILVLFPILFFIVTKGNLETIKIITGTFMDILEKDFWIIIAYGGFLTNKDWAMAYIEKAKALASGLPNSITVQDGGQVTNMATNAKEVKADNVQTLNSENTTVGNKQQQPSNEVE